MILRDDGTQQGGEEVLVVCYLPFFPTRSYQYYAVQKKLKPPIISFNGSSVKKKSIKSYPT